MMVQDKLCLLWQNVETRQWYHVGNLFMTKFQTYIFSYENEKTRRGLNEALENGYFLHPTFQDRYKKYESKQLFSTFARRLPNKNRNDYLKITHRLSLDENASDFELLAATGGKLVADNYEFVNPIYFNNNFFEVEFYVRGLRHYLGKTDILKSPELRLERDPENRYDSHAVAVYNGEDIVGYVPAFYSDFVYEYLCDHDQYHIENFTFNQSEPSHYKLKLKISGDLKENSFKKYSSEMFIAI